MKVTVQTPSSVEAKTLADKATSPLNVYKVVSVADDTVTMVIDHDVNSALDLLVKILAASTWYAPGATTGLSDSLKQTARIVDGKRRDRQIDEAVNGPADYGTPDPRTKTNWDQAKNWAPRRDPLTFDLDGDGLETVGATNNNPILFDHDGDGHKNGTGWVASDDAMLVLDRNGNGTIDNGRELFGDSTIKSNGQTATDGFDALADLDSNHDGVVNNQDAQFANLKLWRDLNQDGISQAGELFTLNALGVSSINIASTATNQTLANGNQVVSNGSYTKADGSKGTIADINLADDTFHRQFGNVLNTSTVAKLPDMQGRGAVRDLREAANDVEWRVVV